jgi:ABC-type multidrug transport system permease subunit
MSHRLTPLVELTRARIKEFFREPAAIFWVYGFPLIMAISLGIAFRERPKTQITVDLVSRGGESAMTDLREALAADGRFTVQVLSDDSWRRRLRDGKTDLVILPPSNDSPTEAASEWELWQEPRRAESLFARQAVENVLLKQRGATPPPLQDHELSEAGSRYIDFLVPGLLGINLMGGGLFGVGFVLVDMRVKKLLKRFLATPLRHRDFLLSVILSRLLFMLPEICALLGLSWLLFGVGIQGSVLSLIVVILLGGFAFAGLGLLIASRATTLETASGLLNLVMLPMYVLSGVFFSSERFPAAVQPFIRLLPLTALNDALRGVMLEGLSLGDLWRPVLTLIAWGAVSFAIALRIFRW